MPIHDFFRNFDETDERFSSIDDLPDNRGEIAKQHYLEMIDHYGAHLGVRNARKHLAAYIENNATDDTDLKHWRAALCRETDPGVVIRHIDDYFSARQSLKAA